MAKASKKSKQKRKSKPSRRTVYPVETRVRDHVGMVTDPCNSVLTPTAYRGKDGFINRFTAIYSSSPAPGETCGLIAYWPRYNRVFQRSLTSDTDPLSLDFYNATFSQAGPGGAFLGANAGDTRPVAACLTSSYVGTELDRQGYIVSGCIPYGTLTGAVTVAKVRQLCQKWQRTHDGETETKWIPTPSDEEYVQIPATNPVDPDDDNVIIHLYSGFAPQKALFYFRVVNIFEWQPYYGLGISCPTPNTPDVPGGLEKVRTTLWRMGDWWQEATQTAATALRVGANVYNTTRALTAATSRVVPLLM